jgi:hypothetical protein
MNPDIIDWIGRLAKTAERFTGVNGFSGIVNCCPLLGYLSLYTH